MSEYHIATGNLPLSVSQLEMALAAPNITAVQRGRYQARLDEVREVLFEGRKKRNRPPEAGSERRRQSRDARWLAFFAELARRAAAEFSRTREYNR